MPNNPNAVKNLIPAKKGEVRNPHGRPKHPKNFAELRETIQAFLAEPTTGNKTRLLKVLDAMARNKGERKALLEFAFGKVPLVVKGEGDNGEIVIKFKDESSGDNKPTGS